jgi:hypothetical protein
MGALTSRMSLFNTLHVKKAYEIAVINLDVTWSY